MEYYYSNDGNDKKGPVSFQELKQKKITSKTLIWHEGMDDWKQADEITKLKSILEKPEIDLTKPTLRKDSSPVKTQEDLTKPKMFSKPFSFKGRIRRLEYGLSFIIWYIYIILCSFTAVAAPIFMLFGLWFLFAQGTKRCHDINNPGWYQILPFYVLWMFFANGDKGANSYGGNPKGLN